ncbi:MAG: ExbD/TolR family protein [Pirellulaceae bacterium]
MRLTSRSGKHGGSLELNMTPMIDCVFLLLIFFMTTAAFQETERELNPAIKVQRASARAAGDFQPAVIDVVRGAGGKFVYRVGGREIETQQELTLVLRQFDNKIQGAFVRVSDDAIFDLPAAAIQAAKDAGFPFVSYVPLDQKN